MLVAGVDVGARNVSAVILQDGHIVASGILTLAGEGAVASREAITQALKKTAFAFADLRCVVATGCGASSVPFAHRQSAEVVCQARGTFWLLPSARTVLNLGAESSRAIRVGASGRVEAFAKNDRCAAGSGLFLETMSRVLEVPLAEMGDLSLKANGWEEVSSICAVFAESEVISHVHRGVPRERILAGVHKAVASRILETLGKVGIKSDVVATGGVAKNKAVVRELEGQIRLGITVPAEPQLVGALGAALAAQEQVARS